MASTSFKRSQVVGPGAGFDYPEHATKKPRFDLRNPSALATDEAPDDDDEFLHADEIGQGRRVRRNAVNVQGYDSDSETEYFDTRAAEKARERKQESKPETDDMFAESEDEEQDEDLAVKKKKMVKFMDQNEIQGEVRSSRAGMANKVDLRQNAKGKGVAGTLPSEDEDEEDADDATRDALDESLDTEVGAGGKKANAPLLDAFNVRAEMDEGRYDEAGNYVRKAADPEAIHDGWLEGVSKKDMRKAAEAAERREVAQRKAADEQDNIFTADLLRGLITNLQKGEMALEALARLNKRQKSKPKWQVKAKNQRKNNMDEPQDEKMTDTNPDEDARKQSIEQITVAADNLLSRGQPNIYETERELLTRQYHRETGEPWVDPKEPSAEPAMDGPPMWEFRWSDSRDGGQAHGPYDANMMQSWSAAGYFGQGVEFRKAGSSDNWSREAVFV